LYEEERGREKDKKKSFQLPIDLILLSKSCLRSSSAKFLGLYFSGKKKENFLCKDFVTQKLKPIFKAKICLCE